MRGEAAKTLRGAKRRAEKACIIVVDVQLTTSPNPSLRSLQHRVLDAAPGQHRERRGVEGRVHQERASRRHCQQGDSRNNRVADSEVSERGGRRERSDDAVIPSRFLNKPSFATSRFPECSQEIDPLTNKSCVELGHQNNLADITLLLLLSNCEGAVFKTAITFIASKTSDSRVAVLEDYLQASTQEHRLKCAVMRTGPRNAKLVTVSTAMAKQAFKTSLRYLGRFELSAVPVARNEETGIEIFRACDYGVDGGDKVDVVLKFSKELGVVEDELYARKVRVCAFCLLIINFLAVSNVIHDNFSHEKFRVAET